MLHKIQELLGIALLILESIKLLLSDGKEVNTTSASHFFLDVEVCATFSSNPKISIQVDEDLKIKSLVE